MKICHLEFELFHGDEKSDEWNGAGLIKAGGRTICLEFHKVINSIWNKEEMTEEWKESIIVPIYMKGDKTECSNYSDISLLSTTYKFYPTSCCQG